MLRAFGEASSVVRAGVCETAEALLMNPRSEHF